MTSLNYKNYNIDQSITNQQHAQEIVNAQDKDVPFNFQQWVNQTQLIDKSATDAKVLYDQYLNTWSQIKSGDMFTSDTSVTEMFSSFLKQLPVDMSDDESRYINNIDYSDRYEVETALKFFVTKLKTIAHQTAKNRQDVSFQTTRNSVRGSTRGVSLLIKDYIINLINDSEFISLKTLTQQEKDQLIDQLHVDVTELYDNKLTGLDSKDVTQYDIDMNVNTDIDYDSNLFTDYEQAVTNLLSSYGTVLARPDAAFTTNTGDEISLNFTPDIETVADLPRSEFVDYNKTDLNLESVKKIVPQLLSSDMKYIDTKSDHMIKDLFNGASNLNRLNMVGKPKLDMFENSHVYTRKQLGNFYTPAKLGVMKYYSFNFKPQLLDKLLERDRTYVFPALDTSATNSLDLPVDYYEDFTSVKNSTIESGHPGEISYSIDNVPRFNSYQSVEQTNTFSVHGISRKDDSFDFWTGEVDDIWANDDVYELEAANVYDIDGRQKTMYVNTGHLYNWKTDAYGNEYGVLKKLESFDGLTVDDLTAPDPAARCIVVDGDLFKDASTRQEPVYNNFINDSPLGSDVNQYTPSGFYHQAVYNCMFFSRVDCVFEEPELETVNVDAPSVRLRGDQIYCKWLDGYYHTFTGIYELESTNKQSNPGSFVDDPSVSKIWDCMEFKQTCIDAPITDVFYKLESSRVYSDMDNKYVDTQVQDLDDSPHIDIETQQVTPGSLVVRTADSGMINDYSVVCDTMMSRYTPEARSEIQTALLDVDIIAGDVLIIKTTNYYIIDRVKYDYDNNIITSEETPIEIHRSLRDTRQHLISDWFYNEHTSMLVFGAISTHVDQFTGDNVPEIKIYWLNIKSFTIRVTNQNIDWYNDQEIISRSISHINNFKIAYNSELGKYYLVTTCLLRQFTTGAETFCIFTGWTTSESADMNITLYTTETQAITTITNRDQEVVDSQTLILQENDTRIYNGEQYDGLVLYKNSVQNRLQLDISRLAPDNMVTRVEVMFGDELRDGDITCMATGCNWNPTYVMDRKPVITYEDFDNLVGTDTRDPKNYLIEHVYTNNVDQMTCTVKLHTIESPDSPHTYTIHVSQQLTDITTAFGQIATSDASNHRRDNGVSIRDVDVFVDEFGAENMMLMLTTTSPSYTAPVILKLAEPIRVKNTYLPIGSKIVEQQNKLEDPRIEMTYSHNYR